MIVVLTYTYTRVKSVLNPRPRPRANKVSLASVRTSCIPSATVRHSQRTRIIIVTATISYAVDDIIIIFYPRARAAFAAVNA